MSKLEAAEQLLLKNLGAHRESWIAEVLKTDPKARAVFDAAARVVSALIPDPRIISLSYENGIFTAEERRLPGSPPVGRGRSMDVALAEWLRYWAPEFGILLVLEESAQPFEMIRRVRESQKR